MSSGTVLLAEPNPELRHSISASLRAEGYSVEAVGTLLELPGIWRGIGPDVLILAGEVAGTSARPLLEQFRSQGWKGALLLIGRPRSGTPAALEADKTLPRPMVLQDVLSYLLDTLRGGAGPTAPRTLRLKGCVIDLGRQTISAADGLRRMTTKETEFLAYLSGHPGRTVTRDELLKQVWGYRAAGSSRVVDKMLTRLRSKIGDDASSPTHIFTVYGGGYRFEPLPDGDMGSIPSAPPVESPGEPRRESTSPLLTARPTTNLSPDGTSFVGREDDLLDLADDLSSGARLVTILGPGGAGKTRLARHFGRKLLKERPPAGGVWFIDLTEAQDLQDVLAAVCAAVELHPDSGDDDDPVIAVGHAIAELGNALLILDNYEQLVNTAGDAVGRWLDLAPHARFLVTAREPLRLGWERCFELDPLSAEDAAALFVERASAARRGFGSSDAQAETVNAIVALVDRLPLAIELAAARVTSMSVDSILHKLTERMQDVLKTSRRDVPSRQATLWNTVDWSWELLSKWEQEALCQCAVFRGGFFLDAAESVLDLSLYPDAPASLDVVEELVRKSLIRRFEAQGLDREVRFRLYETIRDYAEQRSNERPLAAEKARERHRVTYLSLGTELAERVRRASSGDALRRLLAEHDNLVAILRRSDRTDPRSQVQAALALDALLAARGPASAHRKILDQALEASRALRSDDRARVLQARGRARQKTDPYVAAETDLTGALVLAEDSGDSALIGEVSRSLGNLRCRQGLWEQAVEHYQRALVSVREQGDRGAEARILARLGAGLQQLGRISVAVNRYREAIRIRRELADGNPSALADGSLLILDLGVTTEGSLAGALSGLSVLGALSEDDGLGGFAALSYLWGSAMPEGTASDVDGQLADVLEQARVSGDLLAEALLLASRGVTRVDAHRWDEAEALFRGSLEVLQRVGHQPAEGAVIGQLGRVRYLQGRLEDAEELFDRSRALLRRSGDRRAQLYVLAHLAALQADSGLTEVAGRSLERAHRLATRVGDPLATRLLQVCGAHVTLARGRADAEEGNQTAATMAATEARSVLANLTAATGSIDLRVATRLLQQALKRPEASR